MSLHKYKRYIEEGDLVALYLGRDSIKPMIVTKDESHVNKFGTFPHNDWIGKEYGSKVVSSRGTFIYLLHPTPELWTLILPHRTQILYIADISFISAYLDLKPGTRMIESGTGSGSFSHSIARTIAPTGHLFSFEFHERRADIARQEFKDHGLDKLITLSHRDVCQDGFDLQDTVNAVFLDLPAPWEAVGSAKKAFKQHRTGKICTFSPCMEQVMRTVTALNEHQFVDITMFECLIRNYDVQPIKKLTVEDAINNIRAMDAKRRDPQANAEAKAKRRRNEFDSTDKEIEENDAAEMIVSRTRAEMKGHTSYLTFATFLPIEAVQAPASE
ncbi:tRNA (adenine-N(1)-)-methyltransferase catalytic subunit trm61 [Umbelopsis sp. WA50703]